MPNNINHKQDLLLYNYYTAEYGAIMSSYHIIYLEDGWFSISAIHAKKYMDMFLK